jgi:DNA-binding MarR family transcriptional regulator
MKTILFYWSKGADTRRKLLRLIADYERHGEACYLNVLAEKIKLSHVAIKKHVDLMIDEDYVKILNPGGKPVYLALTPNGIEILKEFSS